MSVVPDAELAVARIGRPVVRVERRVMAASRESVSASCKVGSSWTKAGDRLVLCRHSLSLSAAVLLLSLALNHVC